MQYLTANFKIHYAMQMSFVCQCQSLLRFLTMRKARDQKMRKATNKTKYACKTQEQVVQELRLASNKIKMLMQWKQRAMARL